jgi:hypothetical protein
MQLEFTRELYNYLIKKGYSHLYSIGNIVREGEPDNEDYVLVPLQPEDPRIHYEETDAIVNAIESDEVRDMVGGDEFITFYIELSEEDFADFKKLS